MITDSTLIIDLVIYHHSHRTQSPNHNQCLHTEIEIQEPELSTHNWFGTDLDRLQSARVNISWY